MNESKTMGNAGERVCIRGADGEGDVEAQNAKKELPKILALSALVSELP